MAKRCIVTVVRPIEVVQNATKRTATNAKIRCAITGAVLHDGQPAYIKRVAERKYNHGVQFATKAYKS